MSVIKNVVAGTLLASSALGFNSCVGDSERLADSRKGVVKELLADRPVKEYNKAVGSWREGLMASADAQSTIDSIAFRQVFDGTILSTDSESVKEFNAIAAKMRVKDNSQKNYDAAFAELDNKMIDMNITTKQMEANAKEYRAYGTTMHHLYGSTRYDNNERVVAARQFKVDSMAYTNFFKERGRLTPGIEKRISDISKKIKLKP